MAPETKKRPGRSSKKSTKKPKAKYKIRNWHDYNQSLVNRGRMLIWVDPEIADKWYVILPPEKKRKRGRSEHYTDLAVKTTLEFGAFFHQPLRQSEGLLQEVFHLLKLPLEVPDYSTNCRRQGGLALPLAHRHLSEPVDVIVDATGLKVYGEGEWKVRKHGYGSRRLYRKLHLEITPDGEVRAVALSGESQCDHQLVDALLDQEEAAIARFTGDGGYDKRPVYRTLQARGTVKDICIPPQKNAKIWQHGNCSREPHPRDENVRTIRASSRKAWKESCGYHRRSLAETAIFRYKTAFTEQLHARRFDHQAVEVAVKAGLLNKMWKLGMPDSYRVG